MGEEVHHRFVTVDFTLKSGLFYKLTEKLHLHPLFIQVINPVVNIDLITFQDNGKGKQAHFHNDCSNETRQANSY